MSVNRNRPAVISACLLVLQPVGSGAQEHVYKDEILARSAIYDGRSTGRPAEFVLRVTWQCVKPPVPNNCAVLGDSIRLALHFWSNIANNKFDVEFPFAYEGQVASRIDNLAKRDDSLSAELSKAKADIKALADANDALTRRLDEMENESPAR